MKIQPQIYSSNINFNAKYKILKKDVPQQLGDFVDLIAQKVAKMQQADAHEVDGGKAVVFDIHNRFNRAFENHLDDVGIKFNKIG